MKRQCMIMQQLPRLEKIVVFLGIILFAKNVMAEITEKRDSSDFMYKYEMESQPSQQDLDENGTNDFEIITGGGSSSVANGLLSLVSLTNQWIWYRSDSDGQVWHTLAPTRQSGYTVEIRLRVKSETDSHNGVITLGSSASDSAADSTLRIGSTFVKWGETGLAILQSGVSNTNDFHTFRFAMQGGLSAGEERFSVWRDGVLLADDLTDTIPHYSALNRIYFGDTSGKSTGGNVDISYFRFTSGAYSPATTSLYPQQSSAEFSKKFEMNQAAGEVDPAGDTAEWERKTVEPFSAELTNGLLEIDTSDSGSAKCYWESITWPYLTSQNVGFTMEFKVRVDASVVSSSPNAVFYNFCGNGRAAGALIIGVSNISWNTTANVIDSRDNSDKMHVFRMVYDDEITRGGFKVWRDRELIGSLLPSYAPNNRFYFGESSGNTGGSGVYDYVRFTMGCFAPDLISDGTLIQIQ